MRPWRAVPVGWSYRRAPLPTHKSCPSPDFGCCPACTRQSSLLANLQSRLIAALSLPQINCALDSRTKTSQVVSGYPSCPSLSRAFHFGCASRRALTLLGLCKINKRKIPTWSCFVAPSKTIVQKLATAISRKSAIGHQPYGTRFFLKLVMGSQYLLSTLTSRFGNQTSTCTTSNH